MSALSIFGERLRAWRKRRGLSQLDLAAMAETTPRYVSFIETGRSRPGRGVVMRLAEAMDLPLRDCNDLLTAAGLTPAFSEKTLDDEALAPVHKVIDHILENHNPYPACLLGPGLRFLKQNRAAERLFPGITEMSPEDMIDAWFDPSGVENWEEVAHAGLAALRHEVLHRPHPDLPALLRRAEARAEGLGPPPDRPQVPVMCPTMVIDGQRIRTITTVMRFDKATDVTTAELRIELVFPADEVSEAFFRRLAE